MADGVVPFDPPNQPVRQWFRDITIVGDVAEDEAAAYGYYYHRGGRMSPVEWNRMTWQERYEHIMRVENKRPDRVVARTGLDKRYWFYN